MHRKIHAYIKKIHAYIKIVESSTEKMKTFQKKKNFTSKVPSIGIT